MNSIQHEPLQKQITYLAQIQLSLASISTLVSKNHDVANELNRLGLYLPPSNRVAIFNDHYTEPEKKKSNFLTRLNTIHNKYPHCVASIFKLSKQGFLPQNQSSFSYYHKLKNPKDHAMDTLNELLDNVLKKDVISNLMTTPSYRLEKPSNTLNYQQNNINTYCLILETLLQDLNENCSLITQLFERDILSPSDQKLLNDFAEKIDIIIELLTHFKLVLSNNIYLKYHYILHFSWILKHQKNLSEERISTIKESIERQELELNENGGFHCPVNHTIKKTIDILNKQPFIIKNQSDKESYNLKKRCLNTLLSTKQKLDYIENTKVFKNTLYNELLPLFEFYNNYEKNDLQKHHIFECLNFFEENIEQFNTTSLVVYYAFKHFKIHDTSSSLEQVLYSQGNAIQAIISAVLKLQDKRDYNGILSLILDVTETFSKTQVDSWITPIIHTILLLLTNHDRQLFISALSLKEDHDEITTLFTAISNTFNLFTPTQCTQFKSYCSKTNISHTEWTNSLYFINSLINHNQQIVSLCNHDHLLTLFQKLTITSTQSLEGLEYCLQVLEKENKLLLLDPIRHKFFKHNISKSLHESFDFSSFTIIKRTFPSLEVHETTVINKITDWYKEANIINDFLLIDSNNNTLDTHSSTNNEVYNPQYSLNYIINNWLITFSRLAQQSNTSLIFNKSRLTQLDNIIALIFTLIETDNQTATTVFTTLAPYISKKAIICDYFCQSWKRYNDSQNSEKKENNRDFFIKKLLLEGTSINQYLANKLKTLHTHIDINIVKLYLSPIKNAPTIIDSNTCLKLFACHFLQDSMIHVQKSTLSLTEFGVESTRIFINKNLPLLYPYMNHNDLLELQELSNQVLLYSNKQLKKEIETLINNKSNEINTSNTHIYLLFLELLLSLIQNDHNINPFLKQCAKIAGFGPLLGKILFKLSCNINEFQFINTIILTIPKQTDFWACLTELTPHTFIYEDLKDPEKEFNLNQHGITLIALILKCIKTKGDKESKTQQSYINKRDFAKKILNQLHHNYLQIKKHGKARLSELLLETSLCLYNYNILLPEDVDLLIKIKSKRKQVLIAWQQRHLEFLNLPSSLNTDHHYHIVRQVVNQDHSRIHALQFTNPRRYLILLQLIINTKNVLTSKKDLSYHQQQCYDILLKKIPLFFNNLNIDLLVEKPILQAYNESHIFYEKLHNFETLFFEQLTIAEQTSFLELITNDTSDILEQLFFTEMTINFTKKKRALRSLLGHIYNSKTTFSHHLNTGLFTQLNCLYTTIKDDKDKLISTLISACDTLWNKYNNNHNLIPKIRATNAVTCLILNRHYSVKENSSQTPLKQLCSNIKLIIEYEKHVNEDIESLKSALTLCLVIYLKCKILYSENPVRHQDLSFINAELISCKALSKEECQLHLQQLHHYIARLYQNCDKKYVLEILNIMFLAFNVKSLFPTKKVIALIRLLSSYNINNDWIMTQLIDKDKVSLLINNSPFLIINLLTHNTEFNDLLLHQISAQKFPQTHKALCYLLTGTPPHNNQEKEIQNDEKNITKNNTISPCPKTLLNLIIGLKTQYTDNECLDEISLFLTQNHELCTELFACLLDYFPKRFLILLELNDSALSFKLSNIIINNLAKSSLISAPHLNQLLRFSSFKKIFQNQLELHIENLYQLAYIPIPILKTLIDYNSAYLTILYNDENMMKLMKCYYDEHNIAHILGFMKESLAKSSSLLLNNLACSYKENLDHIACSSYLNSFFIDDSIRKAMPHLLNQVNLFELAESFKKCLLNPHFLTNAAHLSSLKSVLLELNKNPIFHKRLLLFLVYLTRSNQHIAPRFSALFITIIIESKATLSFKNLLSLLSMLGYLPYTLNVQYSDNLAQQFLNINSHQRLLLLAKKQPLLFKQMILSPIIAKQLPHLFKQLKLSKTAPFATKIIEVLTKLSESESIQFLTHYTSSYIEEKHLLIQLKSYIKSIHSSGSFLGKEYNFIVKKKNQLSAKVAQKNDTFPSHEPLLFIVYDHLFYLQKQVDSNHRLTSFFKNMSTCKPFDIESINAITQNKITLTQRIISQLQESNILSQQLYITKSTISQEDIDNSITSLKLTKTQQKKISDLLKKASKHIVEPNHILFKHICQTPTLREYFITHLIDKGINERHPHFTLLINNYELDNSLLSHLKESLYFSSEKRLFEQWLSRLDFTSLPPYTSLLFTNGFFAQLHLIGFGAHNGLEITNGIKNLISPINTFIKKDTLFLIDRFCTQSWLNNDIKCSLINKIITFKKGYYASNILNKMNENSISDEFFQPTWLFLTNSLSAKQLLRLSKQTSPSPNLNKVLLKKMELGYEVSAKHINDLCIKFDNTILVMLAKISARYWEYHYSKQNSKKLEEKLCATLKKALLNDNKELVLLLISSFRYLNLANRNPLSIFLTALTDISQISLSKILAPQLNKLPYSVELANHYISQLKKQGLISSHHYLSSLYSSSSIIEKVNLQNVSEAHLNQQYDFIKLSLDRIITNRNTILTYILQYFSNSIYSNEENNLLTLCLKDPSSVQNRRLFDDIIMLILEKNPHRKPWIINLFQSQDFTFIARFFLAQSGNLTIKKRLLTLVFESRLQCRSSKQTRINFFNHFIKKLGTYIEKSQNNIKGKDNIRNIFIFSYMANWNFVKEISNNQLSILKSSLQLDLSHINRGRLQLLGILYRKPDINATLFIHHALSLIKTGYRLIEVIMIIHSFRFKIPQLLTTLHIQLKHMIALSPSLLFPEQYLRSTKNSITNAAYLLSVINPGLEVGYLFPQDMSKLGQNKQVYDSLKRLNIIDESGFIRTFSIPIAAVKKLFLASLKPQSSTYIEVSQNSNLLKKKAALFKEKIETLLFTKRELRHIDFSLIKTTLRYLKAESIIEDSSIDTSINVVKDIIEHIENGNIDPLYNFSFSATLFALFRDNNNEINSNVIDHFIDHISKKKTINKELKTLCKIHCYCFLLIYSDTEHWKTIFSELFTQLNEVWEVFNRYILINSSNNYAQQITSLKEQFNTFLGITSLDQEFEINNKAREIHDKLEKEKQERIIYLNQKLTQENYKEYIKKL